MLKRGRLECENNLVNANTPNQRRRLLETYDTNTAESDISDEGAAHSTSVAAETASIDSRETSNSTIEDNFGNSNFSPIAVDESQPRIHSPALAEMNESAAPRRRPLPVVNFSQVQAPAAPRYTPSRINAEMQHFFAVAFARMAAEQARPVLYSEPAIAPAPTVALGSGNVTPPRPAQAQNLNPRPAVIRPGTPVNEVRAIRSPEVEETGLEVYLEPYGALTPPPVETQAVGPITVTPLRPMGIAQVLNVPLLENNLSNLMAP